jgi:hypothetical protein
VRVAVVVPVREGWEVDLAHRQVGGRPWIAHITARLGSARSVTTVAVVCRPEWREQFADSLGGVIPVLSSSDDPIAVARDLEGAHDAVAFCPVHQLFADADALDHLASADVPADAARVLPVLACEPQLVVTGGTNLQILTRLGLAAAADGRELDTLPAARVPVWPESPELRIETAADFDWAAALLGATLQRVSAMNPADVEAVLDDGILARFPFWDGIGPRPRTILTARCMREPLFERLLRYLRRLRPDAIDVICAAPVAEATSRIAGVTEVIPFDTPVFSLAALDARQWARIQARRYDLCIVPRLEPTAHGFGNITPLGEASRARTAVWLDIFGHSGRLGGTEHGWEPPTPASGLFDSPRARIERGRAALLHFTNRTTTTAAPATPTGLAARA